MAGIEKISERAIIETAEALLIEEHGEWRRVSARKVQKRTGGSNQRVNELISAWREQKAAAARAPLSAEGPELDVPDPIRRVLDETTTKLQELGLSVARLIDEAVRAERQRCDRDVALEQDRAKAAIEMIKKDLQAAQIESLGYSKDLDRIESGLAAERKAKADLAEEMEKLRVKLADAERNEKIATAQAEKQSELRQITDLRQAQFEAQLAENSDAYKNELEAFREDYREAQKLAREKAAELSEANSTIRQLRKQLGTDDARSL